MMKLFNQIEEGFLSFLLLCMVVIIFVEVVLRFVFNQGLDWAQEATLIINAWMVLLGASYCVRERAHISIDFFTRKLKGNTAITVACLALIACMTYCVIFFLGAYRYVSKMKLIGIDLQDIPMQRWVATLCLLFGFGLLFLRFLEVFIKVIYHKDTNILRHVGEAEESMELAKSIEEAK
ncbi:MAG: TRAP transporter small permease [Alphaproteobacteria bacterium]